jgi:endonuclease-3
MEGCNKARIISLMLKEGTERDAPVLRVRDEINCNPFKALVFTMLSARTRDQSTLVATKRLFRIASTPSQIAKMDLRKLEKLLYGVGFYHAKARNLQALCRKLISEYGGKVPTDLKGLTSLPGVGRKTANVMLGQIFQKDAIAVDVHVHRISNRLGWVKTRKPEETEIALMRIVPKKLWRKCNISMVSFGQTLCIPRNPKCAECPVRKCCKRIGLPKIVAN